MPAKCFCSCCRSWRYALGALDEHLTDARNGMRQSLANNSDEKADLAELSVASAQGDHPKVINLRDRMSDRQDRETVLERSIDGVLLIASMAIYQPNRTPPPAA